MGGGISVPAVGAAVVARAACTKVEKLVGTTEKCPYCDQSNWIPKAHGNVCWSCGYTAPKKEEQVWRIPVSNFLVFCQKTNFHPIG